MKTKTLDNKREFDGPPHQRSAVTADSFRNDEKPSWQNTDACALHETAPAFHTGNGPSSSPVTSADWNSGEPAASDDVSTIIEECGNTPLAESDSPIGLQIGDHDVVAQLGRGGMGVVYLAHHKALNKNVAIKMMLHGQHSGAEAVARFQEEAHLISQLNHPNIVQLLDTGFHEEVPYLVLEFIDGKDLRRTIKRSPQTSNDAASIVETLAIAIQHAHDRSILHRDLKPANILTGYDGVPRITDFGLAKQFAETESQGTCSGTIMGSPSYMSPEQAQGHARKIGPASDQYSLGAILYELLTGRPPFLATTPLDTVKQVAHNEPVIPSALQPAIDYDLETICLTALKKDIPQRYESCQHLADDLRRFLDGKPIKARRVTKTQRCLQWCKKYRTFASLSAVAMILILSALTISTAAWLRICQQNRHLKQQLAVVADRNQVTAQKTQQLIFTMQRLRATTERDVSPDVSSNEKQDTLLHQLTDLAVYLESDCDRKAGLNLVTSMRQFKTRLAQSQ